MKRHIFSMISAAVVIMSFVSCTNTTSKTGDTAASSESNGNIASADTEEIFSDHPERQIYFIGTNQNGDIYMNNSLVQHIQVGILSLEPIKIEDISVSVPIETDYTAEIGEGNYHYIRTTDYLLEQERILVSGAFPYYLYQCYRGTNWKEMYELYQACQDSITADNVEEMNAAYERFHSCHDKYLPEYQALTEEDLPEVYLYNILIYFGQERGTIKNPVQVSEQFNTIEIQIGEESYQLDIGEIRLHKETFPEEQRKWDSNEIEISSGLQYGLDTYPWGDGIAYHDDLWIFRAKQDLIISGIYLYEDQSGIELLGAHIQVESGSQSMDFYWDLKTPLTIAEGSDVTIGLFFKDQRLCELEYGARVNTVLEYKIGTETKSIIKDCAWDRLVSNIWLIYAAAFDGLDVSAYFEDYYRPINETWREEIPW